MARNYGLHSDYDETWQARRQKTSFIGLRRAGARSRGLIRTLIAAGLGFIAFRLWLQ